MKAGTVHGRALWQRGRKSAETSGQKKAHALAKSVWYPRQKRKQSSRDTRKKAGKAGGLP